MSVSASALAALLPRSAAAQAWTGATSNDWMVGSNWSSGTVPVAGTGVTISVVSPNPTVIGVNGAVTAATGGITVGSGVGQSANLTIQNGSTLTSSHNASLRIGQSGTGVATVTGAGSQWLLSGVQFVIGFAGNGTLNIENGATVVAQNGVRLAFNTGSSGTLNISGGTLQTTAIFVGLGTRQMNFSNATIRALNTNASFFGGTIDQVNIAAGGLTFDSNGFAVGTLGFSGVGGLTKTGAGTFTLSGASTFTGETVIQQGTLALGAAASAADALATSRRVVANATLDISGITTTGARIQSLAGTGAVSLGARDLIVTNANDTFAGVIGGTGGLTLTGGTQAFAGLNTYTGATTISAGTQALTGAGSIAASSQVIANGMFSIAGLSGPGTTIRRLSGTGAVDLGTRTLTISNANDTFAGVIGGTGGLTITGGTQALSGANTFSGETLVSCGTLALTGTGSISNSSRVVANSTFDISGLTGAGTNIQTLAGSGTVALGARTLTLTNAADTFAGTFTGTGGLVLATGAATLTGNSSAFAGTTTVAGGLLSVNGSLGGTLDVSSAGRLQGTGTVGSIVNAGVIAPGNSFGTLTAAGNYTGNGGTLEMETVLGGDASPTDRLVIAGNTAGSTTVRLLNRGGGGAQTVDGIKIIDVGGASNGTFTLAGDYMLQGRPVIVTGAYGYALYQNGVSTPTDGDWYLRSSLTNPPASPGAPSAPAAPLYQPGVPLYQNYGQVLLGMNQASSLQERVGNRYWNGSDAMARASGGAPAQTDGSWTQSAFWGRVEGGQSRLQPANTASSSYDADQVKTQAGLDGFALDGERGRLIVGLTAQYETTNAAVSSVYGNGRIRAEGAGVGATATWYGYDGLYVDGQAQGMFYRGHLSSDVVGTMVHGNEGVGYTVSVESGKRFAIGNGFLLTPQAQLAYAKVAFDEFTDRFGAGVSLGNADSLLGRLGLSLHYQNIANGSSGIVRSDIYAIGNLHYEFLDGVTTAVAGTSLASANDRLWGSIGGGGSHSWANGRYSVFGEVTYRASLQHAGENHGYKGTGGFRVTW
jgi:outer membrane autotransporter protein